MMEVQEEDNEHIGGEESKQPDYDALFPSFKIDKYQYCEETQTSELCEDLKIESIQSDTSIINGVNSISMEENNTVIEELIAVASYNASDSTQLSFCKGDTIVVLSKDNNIWWWGELNGHCGYFPVNHVQSRDEFLNDVDWQNDEYFGSYGNLKIHLEMLSDDYRTKKYLEAIKLNSENLKGKVILDVGCGTGVISLFCAKYGQPKKVYAVEASDAAEYARNVIDQNGFSDIITVIHSTLENAVIPEKIDLIVSEWMGTLLLAEGMLQTVLKARDLFLKPEGHIWPSQATLFICPCSADKIYEEKVQFWSNVHGFNFSCLREKAQEEFFGRPIHNYVAAVDDCIGKPTSVLGIDICKIKCIDDFEWNGDIEIKKDGLFHGFCTWFEVKFDALDKSKELDNVSLCTGPDHPETHWKQPLLLLDRPISCSKGSTIELTFKIVINKAMPRHFTVKISGNVVNNSKIVTTFCKEFPCWR